MEHQRTFELAKTKCPCCGRLIEVATGVDSPDGIPPKPGDLTICFGCLAPLMFDDELGHRILTLEELQALPQEVQDTVTTTRSMILHIKSKRAAQVAER